MTPDTGTAQNFRLVAQMQATDLSQAAWALIDHFGFKPEAGYLDVRNLPDSTETLRLRRLDQVIEIVRAPPDAQLGHGPFDHLALRANDVDAVVMALRAKWVRLDPEVTPDGPIDLPMFWTAGVRVAFAQGRGGIRFELCQNNARPEGESVAQGVNLGGHDHFGLRCRDVREAEAFYAGFGFTSVMRTEIPTPDGPIDINFVQNGRCLLELASTPQTRDPAHTFAETPLWSKVIIETNCPADFGPSQTGPGGEILEVRASMPEAVFSFDTEDLP